MATAEFSKFASMLSVALSQHHLLAFKISSDRVGDDIAGTQYGALGFDEARLAVVGPSAPVGMIQVIFGRVHARYCKRWAAHAGLSELSTLHGQTVGRVYGQ